MLNIVKLLLIIICIYCTNIKALENFNRIIKTKYFDIVYSDTNYQVANYYAQNVDKWAEDVFNFYGYKLNIRITVRISNQNSVENANSSYNVINMYATKIYGFVQPKDEHWFEDTFKHELSHNMVSLGDSGWFLVNSGIDNFIKLWTHSRWQQEGSAVALESLIGRSKDEGGRLHSIGYYSRMSYLTDRGYETNFWKIDELGDPYLEGSHFMLFIIETYGLNFYKEAIREWNNSYYVQFLYRFEDYIAKKKGISLDKIQNKFYEWLDNRSLAYNIKGDIISGKRLLGQNKNLSSLIKVEDGKLYFANLQTDEDNNLSLYATRLGSVYSVDLSAEFKEAKEIDSFSLLYDLASSSRVSLGLDNKTIYYRHTGVQNILNLGNYAYFIKKTDSYKPSDNLGNTKLLNTKHAMYIAETLQGTYLIKAENSAFSLVKLADNNNKEEVIISPMANYALANLRYSKVDNSLVFAGVKIGDDASYIFIYNLITKELKQVAKGYNPYLNNGIVYFLGTLDNKHMNVYALTLATGKVVAVTNLKYSPTDVVAENETVYYLSPTLLSNYDKESIYEIKKNEWANTPADALFVSNKTIVLQDDITNENPLIIKNDEGSFLTPLNASIAPVKKNTVLYALDGSVLFSFRSADANFLYRLGLLDRRSLLITGRTFENPQLWNTVSGGGKSFNDFMKEHWDMQYKDIYISLLGFGAWYGNSSPNHQTFALSLTYRYAVSDFVNTEKQETSLFSKLFKSSGPLSGVSYFLPEHAPFYNYRVPEEWELVNDNTNATTRMKQLIYDNELVINQKNQKMTSLKDTNRRAVAILTLPLLLEETKNNWHKFNINLNPMLVSGYALVPDVYVGFNYYLETYRKKYTYYTADFEVIAIDQSSVTTRKDRLDGRLIINGSKSGIIPYAMLKDRLGVVSYSKQHIQHSIFPSFMLRWADYKILIRTNNQIVLKDTDFKYTQGTEDAGKEINKGKFITNNTIIFADFLRKFKMPYNLPTLIDLKGFELSINYAFGNLPATYNEASDGFVYRYNYFYEGDWDKALYKDMDAVPLNNNQKLKAIIFNALSPTYTQGYNLQEWTHRLKIDVHKRYKFYPFIGNKNFGLKTLDIIPQFVALWGWSKVESRQSNAYLEKESLSRVYAQWKSLDYFYALNIKAVLSFWRLEPEIYVKLYRKENIIKTTDYASGGTLKKSVATYYSSNSINDTGVSFWGVFRF